jgi:flagellar biosynthesis protein FliQ
MDSLQAIEVSKEAMYVLIKLSLPILLTALVVGLVISLFQALTQIQEQTLSFVPKIIAVFFVILLSLSFIGEGLGNFNAMLMNMIVQVD